MTEGHDAGEAGRIGAGAALMMRMKALGIDYVFANSGTDFPPVIEGLAQAIHAGVPVPEAIVMPFESAAMAMAHGYFLATGRPQAVMAHTNVGLANCAMGAINAACDHIPILLLSGRTPTLEKGRKGARGVPIGWGQEMLDQSALVREACKWDYELRFPEQICDVIDRAFAIATSTPKGPVYVSLPREVLCETVPASLLERRPQMRGARTIADAADVEAAAELIAAARSPVIFAQRGAGGAAAFAALAGIARDWGMPVCQYWAVRLALSSDHPMAADPDPEPLLASADVILVIDSLAPWAPAKAEPSPACKVIQLGPDPLHSRSPARNFRVDLALAGETGPTLLALKVALDTRIGAHRTATAARFAQHAACNRRSREAREGLASAGRQAAALRKPHVSHALSDALRKVEQPVIFGELGCQLPYMTLDHDHAWFDGPHAGGLGWGMPAAMGYKLARPEATVVATIGDGSYIFANPVACHQIAEALGLSILVVILNNHEWAAVRQSVVDLYPDGHAARMNSVPLTSLAPCPDFISVAQASRAWARRVDTAEALDEALAQALGHIRADRGLALVEVTIAP